MGEHFELLFETLILLMGLSSDIQIRSMNYLNYVTKMILMLALYLD